MFDYDRERYDALAMDAMDQGTYTSMAVDQYASAHGAEDPDTPWILSPFDTWERNPFYTGPPARHPEDDRDDEDDAPAVRLDDDEIPF